MKLNIQRQASAADKKRPNRSKGKPTGKKTTKASKASINKTKSADIGNKSTTKGRGRDKGNGNRNVNGNVNGNEKAKGPKAIKEQSEPKAHQRTRVTRVTRVTPEKKETKKKQGKVTKASKAEKKTKAKPVKVVKKETKKSKEEERKDLNKLYSRLLVDNRKSDVVKSTITELLKRLGSGNYCVDSNKRHISRILQACLKYGDTAARNLIFENTKRDFSLLNLNAHSARFLMKLYNYGNAEVKEFLKKEFFSDKGAPLLFSRYGSESMDAIYQKLKNKEQLAILRLYALSNHFLLEKDMVKKLESVGTVNQLAALISQSKSRDSCVDKLKSAFLKMVDKAQLTASLSHDIVYLYWKLTEDKAELISQLYQVFGQLLSTRNGNTVICDLFGYADKKMRKSMLKGIRTDYPDAVYNQINVSFLIKAIHCTDDTKLSIDCLLKPIEGDMKKVIVHKYGYTFIKSILEPHKKVESATSVKDPKIRQEELQKFLLPVLVDFFKSAQIREVMENKYSSQILLAVLKASKDAAILHSIIDTIGDDITEEMELLKNLDTLKFIQSIVKKPGPALDELKPYSILWPAVKPSVHRILGSKSVFLLIDILEAAIKHKDQGVIKDFKKSVTAGKVEEACKALRKKNEKHAGLDVLLKLLKK